LTLTVRRDEWFHTNGDASRGNTTGVRWLRDRQIELPVRMFQFVPDPEAVSERSSRRDLSGARRRPRCSDAYRERPDR
jgi:hypothetical protein